MNEIQFAMATQLSGQQVQKWFHPVNNAMQEFSIINPQDQAMLIAQAAHESANFTRIAESFNYSVKGLSIFVKSGRMSAAQAMALGRKKKEQKVPITRQKEIANLVYAHRYGNNHPTDGWNYRGRGLIQLTFRENYYRCGQALDLDLITQPDLLFAEEHAARSAAWFFYAHNCLHHTGNLLAITRIINGGLHGLAGREKNYARALEALT